MNVSTLFKTACQSALYIAPRILSAEPLTSIAGRAMHHMCSRQYLPDLSKTGLGKISSPVLLQPCLPIYKAVSGLKMKTILHRRCRSCLLLWKEGRRYIKCKKHPRHNQVERQKKEYNTWIVTFAHQKPVRDW